MMIITQSNWNGKWSILMDRFCNTYNKVEHTHGYTEQKELPRHTHKFLKNQIINATNQPAKKLQFESQYEVNRRDKIQIDFFLRNMKIAF